MGYLIVSFTKRRSMKLEDQVTSLELSKKLKKLGVGTDYPLSMWDHVPGGSWRIIWSNDKEHELSWDSFPAFTVAELGEMLPEEIETKHDIFFFETNKHASQWGVVYCSEDFKSGNTNSIHSVIGVTEADARAMMFIYLIESKLMEIPK